jgi:4-hydroxybenzoate polyprenyltransferase
MVRELVKDMEDIEGDARYNCKTLPIVIGIQKTKVVVYAITAVIVALLIYLQVQQARGGDINSVLNLFTTLEVPLWYFDVPAL